ncbi:DUF2863 family protein [Chitinibacteraceae bacterium HSL-7]
MAIRKRPARRGQASSLDAELIQLADGLAESSGQLEDRFWQSRLDALVARTIQDGDEESLNAALDTVAQREELEAYNALADAIEGAVEATRVTLGEDSYDALLFTAPVMAWSRWPIPSERIGASTLQNLKVQLGAHVFARDTKLALADHLFSPDQLPQGYVGTAGLRDALIEAALADTTLTVEQSSLPETRPFLADTRYVIGVALVPVAGAIFRWQEEDGDRRENTQQWIKQGGAVLAGLLSGCASQAVVPGAYHAAWREADRASRAYSVRATIAFLMLTLNLQPHELQATIAPFVSRRLEEYRVGFTRRGSDQVLHGVVWPLMDGEHEHSEIPAEIEGVLRELGLTDVVLLDHDLPLDYCDDCGTPFYPNADGELMHPELPEDDIEAPQQQHLH